MAREFGVSLGLYQCWARSFKKRNTLLVTSLKKKKSNYLAGKLFFGWRAQLSTSKFAFIPQVGMA